MQSFSVIDLYGIAYEVCTRTLNKVDIHSCSKRRMLALEKLCPTDRKLKLDKIKSTSAQHAMEFKFS